MIYDIVCYFRRPR